MSATPDLSQAVEHLAESIRLLEQAAEGAAPATRKRIFDALCHIQLGYDLLDPQHQPGSGSSNGLSGDT